MLSVLKRARMDELRGPGQDRIRTDTDLEEVVARDFGLEGLTGGGAGHRSGPASERGNLPRAIGRVLAARAGLLSTTDSHTGEDVGLFAYHPRASNASADLVGSGVVQNI